MKTFFHLCSIVYSSAAIMSLVIITVPLCAQTPVTPPIGESITKATVSWVNTGGKSWTDYRDVITPHGAYIEKKNGVQWQDADVNLANGEPNIVFSPDHEVVSYCKKHGGIYDYYYMIFNDGTVIRSEFDNYNGYLTDTKTGQIPSGATYRDIAGDDIYALTSNAVYVTRDSGVTWSIDTSGLIGTASITLTGIALDSTQNVFISTSNGIYKQTPKGSVWTRLTSYDTTYITNIYIDRRQRIFAVNNQEVSISIDGGTTWQPDTVGLYLNVFYIKTFGDDMNGNVYLSSSYPVNGLWRSFGGTGAWTRIDGFLSGLNYGSVSGAIVNSICGNDYDSILLAGTIYGLFESTDLGTTWTVSNDGIGAQVFYGFAKLPSGKIFTSTNCGVFGQNKGDTLWQKLYPKQGYLGSMSLWCDGDGTIYTQGGRVDTSQNGSSSVHMPLKSADGGTTWTPDTMGISSLQDGKYSVDKSGNQYMAEYGWPALYTKRPGAPWFADTQGISHTSYASGSAFGTDYAGNLYLALNDSGVPAIWKRAPSQNTWSKLDASGLGGQMVACFTGDKNGTVYAGSYSNGMYKYTGGAWHQTLLPSGQSGNGVWELSVDSSGAVFAAYGSEYSNPYVGTGVYWSTDAGSSWSKVLLDSVSVGTQFSYGLVSFGDSTYALTTDGLYILTRNSSSNIEEPAPTNMLSSVYPNPFSAQTTLSYQLQNDSRVEIDVLNMLGETVEKVFTGMQSAGAYTIPIDGMSFTTGAYFCKMMVNGKLSLHPIVVVK